MGEDRPMCLCRFHLIAPMKTTYCNVSTSVWQKGPTLELRLRMSVFISSWAHWLRWPPGTGTLSVTISLIMSLLPHAKSNELISLQCTWFLHDSNSRWPGQLFHLYPIDSYNASHTCSHKRSGTPWKWESLLILRDWGLPQATATDRLCERDNDACTHSCQSTS